MKRIIVLLFIVCLLLTGCTSKESGNANATFDYQEYDTLEKMNGVLGTNIVSVTIDDKKDEQFGIIGGNLAQYQFSANGDKWCFRASKDVDHDISGLYYDNITFEKEIDGTYYNDEVYLHRFFYDNTQYAIILDVKDKDILTTYFDNICAKFQTSVTGVKSGYDIELLEEGDDIIYRTYIYNEDSTTTISEVIYTFKDDKMISIVNNNIFETEEKAKEYYDLLIENGSDPNNMVLNGKILSSDMNSNLDFYSDITRDSFIQQFKDSIGQ